MTPDELTQRALAAHRQGNIDEADRFYSEALAVEPRLFKARHMLGTVRIQQGRINEAIALLSSALADRPDDLHALLDAGVAYNEAARYAEAAAHFERALALRPDDPDTLIRLGIARMALRDAAAAAICFGKSIKLAPDDPATHFNRGVALRALGDYGPSIADFDRAIALQPGSAIALCLRGRSSLDVGLVEKAHEFFAKAAAIDPGLEDLLGDLVHVRSFLCDWTDAGEALDAVVDAVRARRRACYPFVVLGLLDEPALQLACASQVGQQLGVADMLPPKAPVAARKERIHLAYVSANYYEHAVAYLVAELLERHDRDRFEVTAISLGPKGAGVMRSRIEAAVDRFVDVRGTTDHAVAELLRDLDVDIAVDLMGHTAGARPGIFAYRGVPVQVNYLGYPGTMGAPFIDYIIADRFLVPDGNEAFYSEQVVRLPDCYQPNDTKRRIAERTPTRAELGLPERGFVFCSFNNSFKINPPMFDVWMRLLREVEGSVLWLLETSGVVKGNLRREAEARGLAGERLIFAPRMDLAEHLARHRAADLFLDTLPYNAHTTASDALWAGLPVLTCAGRSFAARVAGSLLQAVGLPELVTTSLAEYEALALALARDRDRLATLRARLAAHLLTAPLFDIERYRRHLEAAYETMWARHVRGRRRLLSTWQLPHWKEFDDLASAGAGKAPAG